MAIAFGSITVTMLDSEYLILNEGVAAPTVDPRGAFAGFQNLSGTAVTASSSAGTTTVTITAGNRNDANVRLIAQRLRRHAQARQITFTF